MRKKVEKNAVFFREVANVGFPPPIQGKAAALVNIFEGQDIELGAERAQTILDSNLLIGLECKFNISQHPQ